MQFLRELLEQARMNDTSAVNNIVNTMDPNYVPLPKPGQLKKGKRTKQPVTDKAMNSLIQTLWFYDNSDAS